ncbi:MAG: MGMT family protein [Nanoarchaeota archaeon]
MNFTQKVYHLVSKIPKGKVSTYKGIAKALNSKAYRAVGTAMNKNPYGYPIPSETIENRNKLQTGENQKKPRLFLVACHRVINSDGRIGGFASGTKNKIAMLKKEGVEIINGRVDMKKCLYNF